MKTVSIRTRLTYWYAVLVACVVMLLGLGVFLGASWGLRKAADQELTSGIDGIDAFLHHKLAIHQMDNLGEELREHSALMPRGKMFRVTDRSGVLIYQPDAMSIVTPVIPGPDEIREENITVGSRSFRTISRFAWVGPYRFLLQVAVDQTEYRELMTGLAWLLILSIPVAGLLAALVGYWMSGRALAPISQITETANSIDGSSLNRRLPLMGTHDELDQLSSTINYMLDRIAASYDRISQFTADASHELRTPIARVRSTAELLLMSVADPVRVQSGLADILSESDFMTRMIRDLLTLARNGLEEGRVSMELFELGESAKAMLPRARSLASTRGITVELITEEDILPVRGNQSIVERTLMILVDNAVHYTPSGGRVWISTWSAENLCGFTVRDNGVGIAQADQERIFERFYRVDTVRTPRDGGSGLGLSIAKSLVELHGGKIHLSSEVGSGSSFEVYFPRADLRRVVTDFKITG
ncbi:sensor histidine kinase [Edaphobacter dinghuensis]|uniref:histidine kinase n=1 Tax=Edaphobacter dinghuensis TaxID=1560005 RepID=A0A917HMQ4_9BACT|nr:HAMP domain-containing sensor histidine kinase [Edaphobacter dinghuensis]GGG83692.1 two-component sensor histidine kinase [Edaphobacter dinghuensis]